MYVIFPLEEILDLNSVVRPRTDSFDRVISPATSVIKNSASDSEVRLFIDQKCKLDKIKEETPLVLNRPARPASAVPSTSQIPPSLSPQQVLPLETPDLSRPKTISFKTAPVTAPNVPSITVTDGESSRTGAVKLREDIQVVSRSVSSPTNNSTVSTEPGRSSRQIPRTKLIKSQSFIELGLNRSVNRAPRESLKTVQPIEPIKTVKTRQANPLTASPSPSTRAKQSVRLSGVEPLPKPQPQPHVVPRQDLKLDLTRNSRYSDTSFDSDAWHTPEEERSHYSFASAKHKPRTAPPKARKRESCFFKGHHTSPRVVMAADLSFKDLAHPSLNEPLKSYNSSTFKLLKTVSDFSAQLAELHDTHSSDLQHLVENFRKKHSELRNERPACPNQIFQAWESLLQEVEVDSQLHSDIAGTFHKEISRPLIEKTFHRKIQSRKIFSHRDSYDAMLSKSEESLKRCRKEHSEAYQLHCQTQSNASLATYFDAHNAYVQQLHAANAMLNEVHNTALPASLQELDDIHSDINGITMDSILKGAESIAFSAQDQSRRYEHLGSICRSADPRTDNVSLVRFLETTSLPPRGALQHRFIHPQQPVSPNGDNTDVQLQEYPTPLKNVLVLDRLSALSSRPQIEILRKDYYDSERQINSIQDSLDSLLRLQQRSLESSLYNKANDLQEDISMKRYEIKAAQIHLAALKAQKELFSAKDGSSSECRDRKLSNSNTGGMKSKWMKAFKSLKTTGSSGNSANSGGATSKDSEKKNVKGADSSMGLLENSHILQEYTYKKITACDVCQQILRGHSRQGLKCRLCKMNVHSECQERVPKCQPKSKLLRRQRSTSEIESKQMDPGDDDAEPVISYNSLIASQPMRRTKELPLPPNHSPSVSASQPHLTLIKGGSGLVIPGQQHTGNHHAKHRSYVSK